VLKGLIALALTAAAWVIWMGRRADARKRLDEIDRGTRCLGCDSREVQRLDASRVRCLVCGHVHELGAGGKVSDREIAELTRPGDE
jgi:hypothetical protein